LSRHTIVYPYHFTITSVHKMPIHQLFYDQFYGYLTRRTNCLQYSLMLTYDSLQKPSAPFCVSWVSFWSCAHFNARGKKMSL